MALRTRLLRLFAGLSLMLVLLAGSFAAVLPAIDRWGATDAELARALPGDELAPQPIVSWTNAIDISARPDQVWPWVAQLGDTRGGFYSYTFIEDRVGAITGAGAYAVDYQNADRVVPEWQHPAPGDMLIQGILRVREVRPGEYLLADSIDPQAMQWTWLWLLEPIDGGERTRLIVRCLIQLPGGAEDPLQSAMMNVGGFVMQQRMLHGLKLRAEGGAEPAYIEIVEIALWLAALAAGLAGAALFVFQQEWRRPLAVAAAAVIALVALTFVQPDIWVRVLADAALLAGAWWAYRPAPRPGLRLHARPAAR
jgi:hypothetical protein